MVFLCTPNHSVEYRGSKTGTYGVTLGASVQPYSVELSMPGHFKGYMKTPVIASDKYGYPSGSVYDFPSYTTPLLLGGDVNGDDVIDMNDLLAEVSAYSSYSELTIAADKITFMNNPANRKFDIRWIQAPASGYGIDYYDFYYIFKNFGKVNQSAIDAGKPVPTAQLTLTQDSTIKSSTGVSVTLKAGDGLKEVIAALNFAGHAHKTSVINLPTLQEI